MIACGSTIIWNCTIINPFAAARMWRLRLRPDGQRRPLSDYYHYNLGIAKGTELASELPTCPPVFTSWCDLFVIPPAVVQMSQVHWSASWRVWGCPGRLVTSSAVLHPPLPCVMLAVGSWPCLRITISGSRSMMALCGTWCTSCLIDRLHILCVKDS
jgi:hypothetical protein